LEAMAARAAALAKFHGEFANHDRPSAVDLG
jgi:hypothetical protein